MAIVSITPEWVEAIGSVIAIFTSVCIAAWGNHRAREAERSADKRIVDAEKLHENRTQNDRIFQQKKSLTIIDYFLQELISRAHLVELSIDDGNLEKFTSEHKENIINFLNASFLINMIENNLFNANSLDEVRGVCELHAKLQFFAGRSEKIFSPPFFKTQLALLSGSKSVLADLINNKEIDWDDPETFEL